MQIIGVQPHLNALEHILHQPGIAINGNALVKGVEVVVVEGQPYRQTLNDEGGQIFAIPAPLLFGVALDQLFVNVRAHQGDGLLFQVFRLGDAGFPALPGDFCLGLGRCHHTPHLVEGVHVKGQGIELALIVGNRGIGKAVKFGELVYIIPDLFVVGVENMGAVNVDIDIFHGFGVYISGDVIPFVNDQNGFPGGLSLLGKYCAVQTCTYH